MNFLNIIRRGGRLSAVSVLSLSVMLPVGNVVAAPPEVPRGATPATRVFPQLNLPGRVYGEEAITALGVELPNVAAFYGMSTASFARMLRKDSSVWLDRKGRVFFVDEFPEAASSELPRLLEAAPFPLGETFTLNSRPGARRVIFLDFDGHVTTGTAWNANSGIDPIVSPAYSSEGGTEFSDEELGDIQKMWRQVAEDFAPFDVNVTTQDPGLAAIARDGSGDPYFGTRVVITDNNFYDCSCGGVAYLRAFDDTNNNLKPAWVFNTGVVGAGEAISHEAGHNLGLKHDGTSSSNYYQGHGSGATGWAPIMGVGYNKALVQWSKGEYAGADAGEDDIALIQDYGAPLMADDHGDSVGTATVLDATVTGGTVTLAGNGLIRRSDDVDVFSFISGAGAYVINVDPAPFSPNLDIRIELRDSAGVLIGSDNPSASLPAALSGTLPAGEYFLQVDGIDKGDPLLTGYTDYGSLGRYVVSGTVPDPGSLAAPVAVAVAPFYISNIAPLTVEFDGSGSTDADGTVVSWDWSFGDGKTDSGELVNNVYDAPGSYTVTLTVMDNDNFSNSDSFDIAVLNQAPIAVASSDFIPGTAAPVTVNFVGDSSTDPDESGFIASYAWNFGDGVSSSESNPSHTYQISGQVNATLTVTDNLGATDVATVLLEIEEPPFVDHRATGELAGSGTVSGSYQATHDDDGAEQWVRERESGGKKSRRYSYLRHTWLFEIPPGSVSTLFLDARQSASSDGDQMVFSYSIDGSSYTPVINLSAGSTPYNAALPDSVTGDVRIRVEDSDSTLGHVSLDTVYVDHMFLRTENSIGGTVPENAVLNSVIAVSSSGIDLFWSDNSDDEYGFSVERSSADTGPWATASSAAADQALYSDTGLSHSTRYYYRVVAYNGAGDAQASIMSITCSSAPRTRAVGQCLRTPS